MSASYRVSYVEMESPETGETVIRPGVPWALPYSSTPGPDGSLIITPRRAPSQAEIAEILGLGGREEGEDAGGSR